MPLTPEGKKGWGKILRKEGLNNVRINLSQDKYKNEGRYIQDYIKVWIKNEEDKILLVPAQKANFVAIVAATITFLSFIANIILFYVKNKNI